ncbi:MAG: hypothetical protein ACYTG6_10165 [Planctomycetota bacterium]
MEGESIFQIVFVVVALLGWILSSAKEAQKRRQKLPPRPPGQRPEPDGKEERRAPEAPRPAPPPPRSPPQRAEPREPARPVPPAPPRPSPPVAAPPRRRAVPTHRHVAREALEAPVQVTRIQTRAAARRSVLQRLAGGGGGGRDAVRRGVLWSEILGPPRALRGPHRSPVLDRYRRR